MKMKKYASFDDYLDDQPPKSRTIIRALRKFVKRVEPELEESVKWGNGCWVKGKAFVSYVYSAPDHVQFGFCTAPHSRTHGAFSKAMAST